MKNDSKHSVADASLTQFLNTVEYLFEKSGSNTEAKAPGSTMDSFTTMLKTRSRWEQLIGLRKVVESISDILAPSVIDDQDRKKWLATIFASRREILDTYWQETKSTDESSNHSPDIDDRMELFIAAVQDSAECDYPHLRNAMDKLAKQNVEAYQVCELIFFDNLNSHAIAELLNISADQVDRKWRYGRAFLFQLIHGDQT